MTVAQSGCRAVISDSPAYTTKLPFKQNHNPVEWEPTPQLGKKVVWVHTPRLGALARAETKQPIETCSQGLRLAAILEFQSAAQMSSLATVHGGLGNS